MSLVDLKIHKIRCYRGLEFEVSIGEIGEIIFVEIEFSGIKENNL